MEWAAVKWHMIPCSFMLISVYLRRIPHANSIICYLGTTSSTRPLVHGPLAIQASKVCRSNIFSVGLNQKSTSTSNESTANYTQRNHKFMPLFGSIPKKLQNFTGSKNVWDHHSYLLIRHITMGNFVDNQGLHGWPRLGWKNRGELSPPKKWDGLEDNGIVNDHNDRARLSFLGVKVRSIFGGKSCCTSCQLWSFLGRRFPSRKKKGANMCVHSCI